MENKKFVDKEKEYMVDSSYESKLNRERILNLLTVHFNNNARDEIEIIYNSNPSLQQQMYDHLYELSKQNTHLETGVVPNPNKHQNIRSRNEKDLQERYHNLKMKGGILNILPPIKRKNEEEFEKQKEELATKYVAVASDEAKKEASDRDKEALEKYSKAVEGVTLFDRYEEQQEEREV